MDTKTTVGICMSIFIYMQPAISKPGQYYLIPHVFFAHGPYQSSGNMKTFAGICSDCSESWIAQMNLAGATERHWGHFDPATFV